MTTPTPPNGGGELERRYRGLLRWFPPYYRRQRGEEMLGVLLDRSAPGQRGPARAEVLALGVQAARAWGRLVFSRDVTVNHRAAGLLAVTLPAVLLLPIGKTAIRFLTLPWSFVWDNTPDLIGYAVWGLALLSIWFGPPMLARWLAVFGTVAYCVAVGVWLGEEDTSAVAAAAVYLSIQLATVGLVWDRDRLATGRRWLLAHRWWVLAALVLAAYWLQLPGLQVAFFAGIYWPAALSTVALVGTAIVGMCTAVGRVLVPLAGAAFAVLAAGHGWWTGVGDIGFWMATSNQTDYATLVGVVVAPVVVWAVLRGVAAIVERVSASNHPVPPRGTSELV